MTWFSLIGTACSFALYSLMEEGKVRRQFYSDHRFRKWDKALKKRYRWDNPYRISRRFLAALGSTEVHAYGETPLTSLEQIAREIGLSEKDLFLDLGCGRGRGVFFLHSLFGCRAIGIDWIPQFVEEAKKVASDEGCGVEFICGDIGHSEFLAHATVIYLAWTCMEEEERTRLEVSLQHTSPGTRIATVSYPLSSKFFIEKGSCTVSFPWGEGEVFFQERKNTGVS